MTLLALSGVVGVTFTGKKHYVTDHLSDCTIWHFACVLLWIIGSYREYAIAIDGEAGDSLT